MGRGVALFDHLSYLPFQVLTSVGGICWQGFLLLVRETSCVVHRWVMPEQILELKSEPTSPICEVGLQLLVSYEGKNNRSCAYQRGITKCVRSWYCKTRVVPFSSYFSSSFNGQRVTDN